MVVLQQVRGFCPQKGEIEREIILERPAMYNFDSKHSKRGLGKNGAMSCWATPVVVNCLHQIISPGIREMGTLSPSPLPPHWGYPRDGCGLPELLRGIRGEGATVTNPKTETAWSGQEPTCLCFWMVWGHIESCRR